MSGREPRHIVSRDNPLLQRVRKLQHDPGAYRKLGVCWLEGEHLGQSLQTKGLRAEVALFAESAWASRGAGLPAVSASADLAVVPDRLFEAISQLPSATGMGWLCTVPPEPALEPAAPTVVLDRVQDAGNVGSILRSAASFGVRQVIALRGTAALWSPKVLRAGMGAHWSLALREGQPPEVLDGLRIPLAGTSSHDGDAIDTTVLPPAMAWVLGHEGGGMSDDLSRRCSLRLRIPQPGGEESLNVAAAAAICVYEWFRQQQRQNVSPPV